MELRQATALTLVGRCQMRPPLPHLNAHAIHVAAAAPLLGWVIIRTCLPRGNARPDEPTRGTCASPATTRASRKNSEQRPGRCVPNSDWCGGDFQGFHSTKVQ